LTQRLNREEDNVSISKNYKHVLIFIIAVILLQIGSLSASGANHFVFGWKAGWMPIPESKDIMIMAGTVVINQQIHVGDEIGVFFQGTLCGMRRIETDSNEGGAYGINIYNHNAVENGPYEGDVLDIRLWDSKNLKELTTGIQVTISNTEIKNSAGLLIWRWISSDTPWNVDINYNSLVTITRIEPSENYIDRTQEITITGINFAAGAQVKIGSTSLSQVSYISATTLKATVPANSLSLGTYDLTVIAGGKSGTLPNGFRVVAAPASVTRVDPNENYADRTQEIIITGTGFTAGARVQIGTIELAQVTFVNSTTLKATITAQLLSVGTYDLAVIMESTRVTLTNGFRVLPPATPRITTISPNNRANDQPVPVLIIGSNLFSGSLVKLGSTFLKVTGYSDDINIIYAEVPAGIEAGTYAVTVISPAGLEGVLANAYKVTAAPVSITQVSPNTSYGNLSQEITVTGKNFTTGAKVKIGSTALSQVTFINTTTLKATVPAGLFSVGTYDLVVAVGDTNAALTNGFTIQQGQEEKMSLIRGLNLVGYPVPAPSSYFSYDFLSQYFTPQSLDSLWHYNSQSNQWEITSWNNEGFPSGDRFAIKNGEGYLVYAKTKKDLAFPGVGAIFETNLYKGMNLVTFSPPSVSFTSYDVVQGLVNGQAEIVAIQRYEKTSGRWYITFCQAGQATGDKFLINKDESYLVYMKKDRLAWIP